jgi:HD-like signal output (HDOD) protein
MAVNYILSLDTESCVFPDVPSVCQQALAALASPDASIEEIGRILSQDNIITARLLQATNSAHFALTRKITDAAEAVSLLGFQTVAGMLADLEALTPSQPRQTRGVLPALVSDHGGRAERKTAIPAL